MPLRDDWQRRIKAVERQYAAVQLATSRLLDAGRRDPTLLKGNVEYRHLVEAEKALEGTYLIRLFAEFETGLRLFWDTVRDTNSRTRDLLDGVAALRVIPDEQRNNAHEVRAYRNSLVHEREEEVEPIPIAVARGYLCRFFSFLPYEW
ncbi:MAG: hypothetical protein L0Z62_45720 [Gemmataceae bacterium]|nr:hypothetical protein [Gemmataceae bacterium]